MEVTHANGALIAARRCLQAMAECENVETRTALWRAAVKYGVKARRDALLLVMQQDARADHERLYAGEREPSARELVF